MEEFIPYCGMAPRPGSAAWNADPVFIALVLACAAVYAMTARRRPGVDVAWHLGLMIFAAAIVSPICNLSVALFSARAGQHVIVSLFAAPLMAAALTCRPASVRAGMWASVVFAVVFWLWHFPAAYNATLQNNVVYWAMQLTVLGAAVWLWALVWNGSWIVASVALFFTSMQMALLGALLTFSPRAFYSVHFGLTQQWGMTPLEDQRLGGLIMWIVAGILLTAYSLVFLGRVLSAGFDRTDNPLAPNQAS